MITNFVRLVKKIFSNQIISDRSGRMARPDNRLGHHLSARVADLFGLVSPHESIKGFLYWIHIYHSRRSPISQEVSSAAANLFGDSGRNCTYV